MKYVYNDYRSDFPKIAQNEILILRKFFPNGVIEHFGSTSIPGVGGKGIIDIYLAVKKLLIPETQKIIERMGYEYKPSGGSPDERWFFQKDMEINDKLQRFHLHLTYVGNQNMVECLVFRDYLRSHPDIAIEYSNIKHDAVTAAKKFNKKADKKKAYMDAKNAVISKIMNKIKTQR